MPVSVLGNREMHLRAGRDFGTARNPRTREGEARVGEPALGCAGRGDGGQGWCVPGTGTRVGRERCEGGREREGQPGGTPGPACGAGRELPGGETHRETFERRQTLPLSTLTPTISPKKAVNPLLPGQARGRVSADRQLPSLPRPVPWGE